MSMPIFTPGTIDDDRQKNRQRKSEETDWQSVEKPFYDTEETAWVAHKAHFDCLECEALEQEERLENPDVAYAKTGHQGMVYLFVVFLGAAYIVTLLLIYSSTHYLVSLLAHGNPVLTGIGIVLVPLAIIAIQITVAVDLYLAEQKNAPRLAAKQRAARIMVLVTPGMILAVFLAETNGLPGLPDVLLLLVRMALAFITDFGIVDNGERAYHAKIFFLFGLKHLRLQRECKRLKELREISAGDTIRSFQNCQQKLALFRANFPDSSFTLPQHAAATKWVLKTWMGDDYRPLT